MLPLEAYNISLNILEETNENSSQAERPGIFCKNSVFILLLYGITLPVKYHNSAYPFWFKISACLTYVYFGGNNYYCNFRHSVGRDCLVQLSVIAHSCRWRHLAAGGFPTPSRRCALHLLLAQISVSLDCKWNSYSLDGRHDRHHISLSNLPYRLWY